jgi:hypothetical protein
MTTPIAYNLGNIWDAVLKDPNVKGKPENIKLANIVHAALAQLSPEQGEFQSVHPEILVKDIATQLRAAPQDLKIAAFAASLVNMTEFQRRVSYKERVALRNACEKLAGHSLKISKMLKNTLYEAGLTIKRWFTPGISNEYKKTFDEGLQTLLQSDLITVDIIKSTPTEGFEKRLKSLEREEGIFSLFLDLSRVQKARLMGHCIDALIAYKASEQEKKRAATLLARSFSAELESDNTAVITYLEEILDNQPLDCLWANAMRAELVLPDHPKKVAAPGSEPTTPEEKVKAKVDEFFKLPRNKWDHLAFYQKFNDEERKEFSRCLGELSHSTNSVLQRYAQKALGDIEKEEPPDEW